MEIIVSKNRAGGELGSIWTKYEHNGGIFLDAGKDYEDAKGFEYYTTSILEEKKYNESENNFDHFADLEDVEVQTVTAKVQSFCRCG